VKVLVSVALWGRKYTKTFADYSLASMLAPDNIPHLAQKHEVVYHIMTTRKDAKWLRRRPALRLLGEYARIDWDFLEDHLYDPYALPTGPEGEKYSFLALLQNIAIKKSLLHDALIFNYADFIWTNGSLTRSIGMLTDGVDAVLSFCLPVDPTRALAELDKVRVHEHASLTLDLPPRVGAEIAIRCLHREGMLHYWDGPAFTVTPTYLLWPVGKDGVVVRAYHQTILALRVKADDPVYRAGITAGSLDGYFTTRFAETSTVRHAANSEDVFVFSLYDTIVNSQIGGPSRASWRGFTREESLRECLRETVSAAQRKFALLPIEVRRAYDQPERWERVKDESYRLLEKLHATTVFDQGAHRHLYTQDTTLQKLAARWQWNSLQQAFVERMLRAPIGRLLAQAVGPDWARILLATIDFLLNRSSRVNPALTPANQQNPLISSGPEVAYARPDSLLKLWLRPIKRSIAGAAKRAHENLLSPKRVEMVTALKRLLGPARVRNIRLAVEGLFVPGHKIAPNIILSGASVSKIRAGISAEGIIGGLQNMEELEQVLATAEAPIRAVIHNTPLWTEGYRALGRNYWFRGRFAEAMQCFAEAERCLPQLAQAAGWDPKALVLLPRNTASVIGLMGHIDGFVKYKILSGDQRPYYLLASENEIVNHAFLDYWRDHITVVTAGEEFDRLAALDAAYGVNWNWVMPEGDDGVVHVHQALARAQRQWSKEKRGNLLTLKETHADLLAGKKRQWGMRTHDWFVCLHVRSAGFYTETGTAQKFRNTPIEDYYPLIHSIIEAGGWVVRMGDSAMPPLDLGKFGPHKDRVIDYAHVPDRSPELDVALCASCKLFVSSPSGLHTVAHAFGRPVCPVNFPMYAGFPWHPGEIFIPQRYFSGALGRVLTLKEILSSNLVHADQHFLLEKAGIDLIHNKPIDIIETVREALNPDDYTTPGVDFGDRVRQEFDRLNREHVVDISGRLGLYFAVTYAHELCPEIGIKPKVATADPLEDTPRRLDVLIPSYNRPARLHRLLATGLAFDMPGVFFVVIDDGSTAFEEVPGLGHANTVQVCESFNTKRVVYIRNPQNMGVAASWQRYYRDFCFASYTMSVTDKDEFVNPRPIVNALRKLDEDPKLSMVVIPLRQKDRGAEDRLLPFNYSRMSGGEYLAHYARDNMLQHASMWGIIRVDAVRSAGVPRPLDLRRYGLDDGFGIDIDFVFMVAALGDVDFEREAHVRRSTIGGATERFPLTFAYTYYQYAKRAMRELKARGIVTDETVRRYVGMWLREITRGLIRAYDHVEGTEEPGTKRIKRHLPMPILLYLPLECLRYGVQPPRENIELYLTAANLMMRDWIDRWQTRLIYLQAVLRG
jgi:putative glycosyltransferase (TIGR04372 family)